MKTLNILGFDFGAGSGRAMLGTFDGNKLLLSEKHRFVNEPVFVKDSLYWDVLRLYHEIKQGLIKTKHEIGNEIHSISVDTWGVDYCLLDKRGELISNPYHYRDKRTEGAMEKLFAIIPQMELYDKTGIQFMPFNTIFQLYMDLTQRSDVLDRAETMLMLPDFFIYLLTGVKNTEYSIASTSQLLDPYNKKWDMGLIKKAGLPEKIFIDVNSSGKYIGQLLPSLCNELGTAPVKVVATASHDTASAVAALPYIGDDFAYISCGTWSLFGVEIDNPLINENTYKYLITNEGGACGKIRFLKNMMGLWLIQECRRQWQKEGMEISYGDMEKMTQGALNFESFIDPDDDTFIAPGNMPERINEYLKKTGQKIPSDKAEMISVIYTSIALKNRYILSCFREVTGKSLTSICIVGGGAKDETLLTYTANSTGCTVVRGPAEATAMGNILVQAMALGEISGLTQLRQVVSNSYEQKIFEPKDKSAWDSAYSKFMDIMKF